MNSTAGLCIAVVLLATASCASTRPRERETGPSCTFIVYNRTPAAIEVRLQVRRMSSTPIGALNPGELLTHEVPCSQGHVYLVGVEIPWQAGAARRFGATYGGADLIKGERVNVTLGWQ